LPNKAARRDKEVVIVNWWILAGGLLALSCAGGHAVVGLNMFYRPIRSAITNELHAGILTGMWHLITIHFTLSAAALFLVGTHGQQDAVAWLIVAQFAGYALLYFIISLRIGGALRLFQWIPFACTAIVTAIGAAN
jgi:hypothetical protein